MTSADWWSQPWTIGSERDPDTGWDTIDSETMPAGSSADTSADVETVLVRALGEDACQVRSRDRVRDLAEVFTHQREVDAMLDMMPDAFATIDIKFLEPACGSGNFLVEILRRKLRLVTYTDSACQGHYEHRLLRALASVYGVDISHENVTEARARLGHVLLERYETDANTLTPSRGFLLAAGLILAANIVQGDTLTSADEVELCDWRPYSAGRFQRVWSYALVPAGERDLFWAERVQDPAPVPYAQLPDELDLRPAPSGARR